MIAEYERDIPEPQSFKVEVTTVGDNGSYCSNGLRFPDRESAETYGADLAWRWTAVRDWRVVPSTEPANR